MPITENELARLCRVSRGTVDRALNNRPGISEKTKQLILQTAREQGYTPHMLASSLARGKTNTVGIIVFDLENRFFSQLVSTIQQQLLRSGIFCYICLSNKDQALEKQLIASLMSRRVDGLILMSVNRGKEFCDWLYSFRRPVVTINNRLDDRFTFVGGAGMEAVQAGMEQLYLRGYRRIHFLCPPYRRKGQENLYAQEERVEGFRRFLEAHADVSGELIARKDYLDTVLRLIREGGRPAVFCASDFYALHLYKAAREHGLRAPADFGLMGFDGVDMLDYIDQRIATVFYPSEEIGRISAECLMQLIADPEQVRRVELDCPVQTGETI